MNMLGAFGAMVRDFFGSLADYMKGLGSAGRRTQWDPAWYAYVVVALIGMTLWSLVNPERTVERKTV